jgi:spore germination protein YaaH
MFFRNKRITILLFTWILLMTSLFYTSSLAKGSGNIPESKFNMSYIFFGEPSQYAARVKDTKESINEISPCYFEIKNDGSLKITASIDQKFINEMHDKGIKVVPFISNHWDRSLGRLALSKRNKLADQIIDAINYYNLDGINVDLENLTEEDRDNYTDFVRLLRSKISKDKTLAVAVAGNPRGFTTGWHGSYDYRALGEYSDYIMIMAYDEHYSGGVAGSVAGIKFVEDSIKYALKWVPGEKVVLGIPFFGRIWKDGGGMKGQGASLNDIQNLLWGYLSQVTFDYATLSPKATVTIKASDIKPYIFGNRLDAGTYTIWYENEDSIKHKLRLVEKYGLKGTGSWSLGQEVSNTWNYYNLWLNGHYFTDSQGHWAMKPIIFTANKGWMIGDGSTSFAPDNSLTRAEAAVVMVRALGLKDIGGSNKDFNDTLGHWARKEIEIASQHQIVFGIGDGTYRPDDSITREEVAVLVDRVFENNEAPVVSIEAYKDVSSQDCAWSYDSIMGLTQRGVLTGSPNGYFFPKHRASRAEMATLLYRLF